MVRGSLQSGRAQMHQLGAFLRGAAGPLPLCCPRHGPGTRGARLRLQHMQWAVSNRNESERRMSSSSARELTWNRQFLGWENRQAVRWEDNNYERKEKVEGGDMKAGSGSWDKSHLQTREHHSITPLFKLASSQPENEEEKESCGPWP